MSRLFIEILNMGLSAGCVALIVMLLRLIIRKAPKKYSYALWAVVFLRLVCPFTIRMPVSAVPVQPQTISQDIVYSDSPSIQSGVSVVDNAVNNAIEGTLPSVNHTNSVNSVQSALEIGAYLWLAGILALLLYGIISYQRLKKRVSTAIRVHDNIYETDLIKTPFVLGFIRPKIYIPTGLDEKVLEYVITHERTHIKRLDYLIKPLAFLVTSIHWFNPIAWVSYALMARDMELSADESVMKRSTLDIRGDYSNSLLALSVKKSGLLSPLGFGETGVKERVKNVLNYKKPAFWIRIVTVVIVIAASLLLVVSRTAAIELPPTASVLSIKMEQINKGTNVGITVIEDSKIIETVLSALSGADKTLSNSVNDYPVNDNILIVRINLAGEQRTLCLYTEGSRYYIEEPYVGIYRSNRSSSEEIYKIYNNFLQSIDIKGDLGSLTAKGEEGSTISAGLTAYDRVKITFLSEMMGFNPANEFETADTQIVAYIDSSLASSLTPSEKTDLNNNYTSQYQIELADKIGGYSCTLYYDTLYGKAYLVKDGGLYQIGTDFARYIDSFLENKAEIIRDDTAVALFKEYGWTLDYQINAMNYQLNDIKSLSGFNSNAYYFAYNNELSKDIGLDMSGYANSGNIDIKIYRIHESMPQEFYPIQNCRGIVVRSRGEIVGVFISAGRHSTFNACSLKGNSFEKVTKQTLNEWLAGMVKADNTEERLSKLEPEQIIEEYFTALENKEAKTAEYCISKRSLLGKLTANMLNEELFNEGTGLPLTDVGFGAISNFDNMKSTKLLKVELIAESKQNTKTFRVTVNLQYNQERSISSGEQFWDCTMVYESPQTGWKIEEFGH